MDLMTEWIDPALPQAPAASGMVRIARGNQQRWIWPVHLPGWIALGWQVSHPGTSAAAAAVPGVGELEEQTQTAVLPEAVSPAGAPAATNACRRGRKAKAQETAAYELPAEPVEAIPPVEPKAAQPSVDGAAESAPATETNEASTPAATEAEAAAPAFVLPDDLLSEAF